MTADHLHSLQIPRLWPQLIRAHDQIFSEANKAYREPVFRASSSRGWPVQLLDRSAETHQ
jgi:hypothetical protein